MKHLKRSDAIWSILLMALPVLALLIGMIPGSIRLYDTQTHAIESYFLLASMPSDMIGTTLPLLLIMPLYTAVLGFCYMRSQKLNTLKALLILAIVSGVVGWMPVLVEPNLQFMPYALVPMVLTGECVAAFIHFKIEDAKFEY